jgi:hypothetical protein
MTMRTIIAVLLVVLACWGCNKTPTGATRVPIRDLTPAERALMGVWTSPSASVRERAEAVNQCFTNGTPIPVVAAVLGTNYGVLRPFSSVWVGPGPEPRKTCSLLYHFGQVSVTIGTSADIGADPLGGEFTGAGYSLPVTPSAETTNRTQVGQPDGAANGSQPIRSETNRTSSAAGSRR